jgi:hypothetical protein
MCRQIARDQRPRLEHHQSLVLRVVNRRHIEAEERVKIFAEPEERAPPSMGSNPSACVSLEKCALRPTRSRFRGLGQRPGAARTRRSKATLSAGTARNAGPVWIGSKRRGWSRIGGLLGVGRFGDHAVPLTPGLAFERELSTSTPTAGDTKRHSNAPAQRKHPPTTSPDRAVRAPRRSRHVAAGSRPSTAGRSPHNLSRRPLPRVESATPSEGKNVFDYDAIAKEYARNPGLRTRTESGFHYFHRDV